MNVVVRIGYRKGFWKVIGAVPPDETKKLSRDRNRWLCRCRCGRKRVQTETSLVHTMHERSACFWCAMRMQADRRLLRGVMQ